MSRLADFYADGRLNCILLVLFACVDWSFFDLLSGLIRDVNGAIINLAIGASLSATGVVGILPIRQRVELSMVPKALAFGTLVSADLALYVFALKYVPVGDVILLFTLNLVWTSIMDSFWQRVRPTIPQLVSIVLAIVGMVFVTRPSFIFPSEAPSALKGVDVADSASTLWGHGMALISGLCYSVGTMLISIFGAVDWSLWILSQGFLTMLLGGVLSFLSSIGVGAALTPVSSLAAFILVLICIFDVTGRVSNIVACQVYAPSLVVLVAVAQIPMTYAWSAIWLGEALDGIKGFGVGCVILALAVTIYSNVTKRKKKAEEEEEKRKILDEGGSLKGTKAVGDEESS